MGSVVPTTKSFGGHLTSPIAEVGWTCVCGTKVKALLDMTKAGVTKQCPNPSCKVTRTLPGYITRLWVEIERGIWREVDVGRLIYPAD
jgi:hypothetical protein